MVFWSFIIESNLSTYYLVLKIRASNCGGEIDPSAGTWYVLLRHAGGMREDGESG
jgi:hypothetical protein